MGFEEELSVVEACLAHDVGLTSEMGRRVTAVLRTALSELRKADWLLSRAAPEVGALPVDDAEPWFKRLDDFRGLSAVEEKWKELQR